MQVQHNDVANTAWSYTLHPPTSLPKRGLWHFQNFFDGYATNDPGRQSVTDLMHLFTPQIFCKASQTAFDSRYEWPDNVFTVNPFATVNKTINLAGGVGDTIGGLVANASVVNIHNAEVNLSLKNLSLVAGAIEVHWFMSKQNVVRTPIDEWQFQLLEQKAGQAAATQSGTPSAVRAGQMLYYFPGARPETVQGFRKSYKTIHVDKLTLQPGGQVNISAGFKYNYKANQQKMYTLYFGNDTTTPLTNQAVSVNGCSIFAVMFARGELMQNSASNRIEYGHVNIGYLGTQKFTFSSGSQTTLLPYQRIYPNTFNESFTPANENFITDTDAQGTNAADI